MSYDCIDLASDVISHAIELGLIPNEPDGEDDGLPSEVYIAQQGAALVQAIASMHAMLTPEQREKVLRDARAAWDEEGKLHAEEDAPNPQECGDRDDDDSCTHKGGHVWNRSAAEADEARLSGDYANDNIRCIHCGADGDA